MTATATEPPRVDTTLLRSRLGRCGGAVTGTWFLLFSELRNAAAERVRVAGLRTARIAERLDVLDEVTDDEAGIGRVVAAGLSGLVTGIGVVSLSRVARDVEVGEVDHWNDRAAAPAEAPEWSEEQRDDARIPARNVGELAPVVRGSARPGIGRSHEPQVHSVGDLIDRGPGLYRDAVPRLGARPENGGAAGTDLAAVLRVSRPATLRDLVFQIRQVGIAVQGLVLAVVAAVARQAQLHDWVAHAGCVLEGALDRDPDREVVRAARLHGAAHLE